MKSYVITRKKQAEVMYLTRAHRYSPDISKAMIYHSKEEAKSFALHNEEVVTIKQDNH
jgi:hypothetical protein